MAKAQRDDDSLSQKVRGITAQRSYDFDVHYFDEETGEKHLKENAPTEEEWKQQIIDDYSEIGKESQFCYFIFHDKDMLEDGNVKPLHVHIVIKFENARRIGALMKKLGISRVENISKVKSYKGALSYLLHVTKQARNDGKFIYSQSDLYMYGNDIDSDSNYKYAHFNNMTVGKTDDKDIKDEIEKVIQEAIYEMRVNGTIFDVNDLSDKFPDAKVMATNLFYNYQHKLKCAEADYFEELAKERALNGRKLITALFSGAGGTGKTELALAMSRLLSNSRGVHVATAKSPDKTYDPFNTYKNQNISVLNEMEGGMFGPREFMDVFDPWHYAPVPSRNNNVHWLADYAFLTTSKSVERFRNEMFRYSKGGARIIADNMDELSFRDRDEYKDEAFQFTRRIKHYVQIVEKDGYKLINVFVFDNDKYGYRLQKQIKASSDYYMKKGKNEELNQIVRAIIYCFEHPEIDITNGKVKKDNDLIQPKEHVDEFAFYDEEFKFDYKKVSKIDLATKHKDMLNDLVTDEINNFVERNEEDFYEYVGSVKYKKDDIKSRDDLLNSNITVFEEDFDVWELEFYDYKKGNIPCVGLTIEEEEQREKLVDKVEKVKAEKRRNEVINIVQHRDFNDKLGVTEDDINKHVENKQSGSSKVGVNPFDL